MEIDLRLSDRRVSIVEEGVDLAIRIGPLRDSSLKMRQLGAMPILVCAAPDYLARAGSPAHPRALSTHECVLDRYAPEPSVWRFDVDGEDLAVPVDGRLSSNAPAASVRFAIAGVAIARCPAYAAADALRSGALIELFAEHRVTPYVVAALYPPNRRLTTRLRSLLDHLAADRSLRGDRY